MKDIKGVITPLITPLNKDYQLDLSSLSKLINNVIDGGVHGIFLLGTTGEGPNLDLTTKKKLIEKVSNYVENDLPLLIGVSSCSYSEINQIISHSVKYNVSAIVATPPYYYPHNEIEVIDWMLQLAEISPIPILLYNIPSMTKFNFTLSIVRELSQHKNIIGLKDSSGDIGFFHKINNDSGISKEFKIFVGPEELLAESVMFGALGGVPGGSNIYPKVFVETYNNAVSNNHNDLKELHKIIIEISTYLYVHGGYGTSVIKGLKYAGKIKGLCKEYMTKPFNHLHQSEKDKIENFLNDIHKRLEIYNLL